MAVFPSAVQKSSVFLLKIFCQLLNSYIVIIDLSIYSGDFLSVFALYIFFQAMILGTYKRNSCMGPK